MAEVADAPRTLGALVAERPARARVLERFGIDYCCGGGRTLAEACAAQGLHLGDISAALDGAEPLGGAAAIDERDWREASLTELCDHIEARHHTYLRDALPRLIQQGGKVARAHGDKDARLGEVAATIVGLANELAHHMMKEERVLFPICRELERASAPVRFHCGTVANPIAVMLAEHDDAGDALAKLRALTEGFAAPEWACPTYRALLAGLDELEQDLHLHIHLENNILFPRAKDAEAANLAGAAAAGG